MIDMDTIVHGVLFIVVILTFVTGYRALRGPSIADRLLATDLITTLITAMIVLYAWIDDQDSLIDLAIALAALSFIATLGIAHYTASKKGL